MEGSSVIPVSNSLRVYYLITAKFGFEILASIFEGAYVNACAKDFGYSNIFSDFA